MKIDIEDNLDEWLEKYSVPLKSVQHLYPVEDEFEHILEVGIHSCWCNPDITNDGFLIIHNSFDGREFAGLDVEVYTRDNNE